VHRGFLSVVITLGVVRFAIISVTNHGSFGPGKAGLGISYALRITMSLNWIIWQTVEVEINVVSVEYILEYVCVLSEGLQGPLENDILDVSYFFITS
jgi:ATP-binding cassette, subfamily C (CFTR/MRP), member 1